MSEQESSVEWRPSVDFGELMKQVEEAVEAVEPAEDLAVTVRQLAVEVLSRFREQLGVFGGRVYRRDGGVYRLIAAFPESRKPSGALELPVDYEPVELLLDSRTIYMDRDDPRTDRELEKDLGVKEFAAVEVGDRAYILAFDIEPDRDRNDVLVSLSIVRHAFNQKLRQERIASVLREARRIQLSIQPRRMPAFGRFDIAARTQSMEIVGGDFYDLIPLGDKILGVAVADVSGHGLPAALLVRDIHMGLRMGLSRDLKIQRVIERLDDIIHQSTLTSRFVSMFYGELSPSGAFIYVNAGHPPPYYLPGSGRPEPLTEGGSVLGPIPDATYDRGFVELEPGDLVVLYTDGVVEAENAAGKPFGSERLIEVVRRRRREPAKQVVQAVCDALAEYCGEVPRQDDRTVMVLRYPKR